MEYVVRVMWVFYPSWKKALLTVTKKQKLRVWNPVRMPVAVLMSINNQ